MEDRESIYEYISSSIQRNGMLPDDFSLEKYLTNSQEKMFDLGAYDGMLFFFTPRTPNTKFVKYIIKLIKTLNEESLDIYCNLIDEYLEDKKEDIRIIDNEEEIIKWIIKNQDIIQKPLLFSFATKMIFYGKNIETVKLGIELWSVVNVEEFPDVLNAILKLALCEEFTLFVNNAIDKVKDVNDIRFRLVKKLKGWGKVFTISVLKAENETIKQWLLTNGCENEIGYSYLAGIVADKINLSEVLKRENLTEDEFIGISKIILGLLEEEQFLGISRYENYIEILTLYIRLTETKFNDKIEYYKVPLEIAKYFTKIGARDNDEEINLMLYLKRLFSTSNVENIIKIGINSLKEEHFHIAMEIIEYYNKRELYNLVFTKFKTNPIKYCDSFYFLMQNRHAQEEIISLVLAVIDKEKFSFNPLPIIGRNDKEISAITLMVNVLRYYPFCGKKIILLALSSNYMYPRNAALTTLEEWSRIMEIDFKEFPSDIYLAVEKLKEKEVIKKYKQKINSLLEIKENLDRYDDPSIELDIEREPNIYEGNIDSLFEERIRRRGKDYYNSNMILSCSKYNSKYVSFVQASELNMEYEVTIYFNNKGDIENMECTCPCTFNCKHEYATLMYINKEYDKDSKN